jgi:hypothetical protein
MKNKFLLCVGNKGYEASLELRKLYEQLPDKEVERHNQFRIIDESGEDYLYPSDFLPLLGFRFKPGANCLKKQPNKILQQRWPALSLWSRI